jgi:hypothetical protein
MVKKTSQPQPLIISAVFFCSKQAYNSKNHNAVNCYIASAQICYIASTYLALHNNKQINQQDEKAIHLYPIDFVNAFCFCTKQLCPN